MPWKDKDKPKVKTRKLTILEERWDMFDKAKAKLEMKYGLMSNGGFLEYLLILNNQIQQTEDELKRKNTKRNKQ